MYLEDYISFWDSRYDLGPLSGLPFDLIDSGKISAIRVQLTGPIPYAKLAMSIASQP
jgi:hypothetical protein